MQINQVLKLAIEKLEKNNIKSAQLDAEILLSNILLKNKTFLCSNPEYELSKKQEDKFKKYISHRAKNEPVAYIINKKEFYGLEFYVNKNVLIPRPETELLVEECLKICKNASQRTQTILEIGTGSGCVIISILKTPARLAMQGIAGRQLTKHKIKYIATDVYGRTLRIAKRNAKIHGVNKKIKFIKSNLLDKIQDSRFMIQKYILIANLPYITPIQYKNNPDLKYEPKDALVGGVDGLDYIKKLLQQVSKLEHKPKYVLLEIDPGQKSKIKKILLGIGKVKIKFVKDLNGRDRVVVVKLVF